MLAELLYTNRHLHLTRLPTAPVRLSLCCSIQRTLIRYNFPQAEDTTTQRTEQPDMPELKPDL